MAQVLKQIFVTGSDQISQNYTIESWHVSQSVDAFTGVKEYDITLSGSFTLTGSQYITGSVSASFGANTIGFHGTSSWAVSSSKAISASNAFTSSYSLTSTSASYALSASNTLTASYIQTAQTASYVLGTAYPSGSVSVPNSSLKILAGASKTGTAPNTVAVTITELNGKTLGQNAFVTSTISGSAGANNTIVVNSLAGNILTFESQAPATDFYYTVIYL